MALPEVGWLEDMHIGIHRIEALFCHCSLLAINSPFVARLFDP
jgi:hypothetical protein